MQQSPPLLRTRLAAASALIAGLWAFGCAGDLPAGVTGQGGTSGGPPPCDALGMILGNPSKCATAGACHGTSGAQGIDLMSPGVVARLVGKMPPTTSLSCAASTQPYLVPNSNPAMGLLLTKLMNPAPCGEVMPFGDIGGALTASDRACIDDWALAAVQGRISQ